jgi:hypothetical protein
MTETIDEPHQAIEKLVENLTSIEDIVSQRNWSIAWKAITITN